MKKTLFLSLFISFNVFGQTPKMEVVASTTEDVGGIKVVLKKTNPINSSSAIEGLNNSTNGLGNGVVGIHSGSGNGVYGNSWSSGGNGVYGVAYGAGSNGIKGYSGIGYGNGVYGTAEYGIGVRGYSINLLGGGIGGYFSNSYATGYALITGTGIVGIGTPMPTAQLDVVRGTAPDGTAIFRGTNHVSHFNYATNEDTYIRGGKAGSKVLINDEAGMGSVGIGLSNPNELLDVNGRMRIRHTVISSLPYTSGIWMSNSTNSLSISDGAFYGMKTDTETGFFIGGTWKFWVNSAGSGFLNGNLIQTSDKRLKKDISFLTSSLSGIYNLNGYHYKWIEESRSKDLQTGLIAQEVQKIFPELVQTDEKGFLSVNYIGLVPHLIEAVKELRDENNSLKTKNQTLESRLDKIEAMLSAIQPNTENSNSRK